MLYHICTNDARNNLYFFIYTCRFVHCRVKVIKNERINEQGLLINGTLTEDNK